MIRAGGICGGRRYRGANGADTGRAGIYPGIGGGAFLLLRDPATKNDHQLQRPRNGARLRHSRHVPGCRTARPRTKGQVVPGGLSVGIPGVIAMLEMAHKKYGKLPWARLFEPAIKLSTDGFVLGPKLAPPIRNFTRAANMPDLKKIFIKPTAHLWPKARSEKSGICRVAAPDRARRRQGLLHRRDREGDCRRRCTIRPSNQGGMTLADLDNYKAAGTRSRCAAPIVRGGFARWDRPPPAASPLCKSWACCNVFPRPQLQPGSLSAAHLFTQATRCPMPIAPNISAIPLCTGPDRWPLDQDYIASRAGLIDPAKDMGTAQAGDPPKNVPTMRPTFAENSRHQPHHHCR